MKVGPPPLLELGNNCLITVKLRFSALKLPPLLLLSVEWFVLAILFLLGIILNWRFMVQIKRQDCFFIIFFSNKITARGPKWRQLTKKKTEINPVSIKIQMEKSSHRRRVLHFVFFWLLASAFLFCFFFFVGWLVTSRTALKMAINKMKYR